jgi:light-regulated signal transduction histidine kinase (bacteriophytochrome)
LDETNLSHLQTVKGATRTMSDLIDALLELSKVTCGEMQLRSVDLSALAAQVFADLHQCDPGRAVKVDITPGLRANGDERLLRVALVNLIENAWKYTRKRPEARIEFGKISDGAGDTYFVRDNGDGFDMAYAGKLFVAFQRLHRSEDFEGVGIGLATVQRVIHRHNGKIRAESIGHQGATFYFTLGDGGPPGQSSFVSN